ncbi:MAG: UDP-N-acetylglucosamine 2-epimerase (hydrolyzing) [Pelagibacteraceae bacterium TMED65]|nr:MAG: UDP-N-acetylglucosamine 2-epimerase (hydrolyzing) [Pelagibacteraceae bacterium TMED65]|tara:strand:- start:191 stop:1321 length:1131 start_codon:yes stop_codon:yes gene_type:complete
MISRKKKIIFVTATRADFGKLKSLISILKKSKDFEVCLVVTGMHVIPKFGNTYKEVIRTFGPNIIKFTNQALGDRLEIILTKTTNIFSKIVKKIKPDLIVLHGDRVEALSAALVGSLNHILTAHIEGGEVSGTIDDTIRHAISKLCHVHFVGSKKAKKRVAKMGEIKKNIFQIGSPDIDVIANKNLPKIFNVKKRYNFKFKDYAILLWHPVTSKIDTLKEDTKKILKFIKKLNQNFLIIYPNNDPGSNLIIDCYKKIKNKKFKILKNMRFEYFLSVLENAKFIIGNSSSAIYEAPMLSTPAINIGDRQNKRIKSRIIKNVEIDELKESDIFNFLKKYKSSNKKYYGQGDSDKKFYKILKKKSFWEVPKQKFFSDIH